ncbi:G1/S-specific cyclin-D2-like [Ciona intestinalis]
MSLSCEETCVVERTLRAKKDPALLDDPRVLRNLLELEDRYLVSTSYFECVQKDVQPYMRKVVATWMMQVCEEQKCEDDVFPLSMNYLDRFLSVHPIHRTQLQSLGSACMLIASKVKETLPLTTEKLVVYTDHSVGQDELLKFELLLLMRLKWDVLSITPIDFVDQILHRLHLDETTAAVAKKHAHTFIHLCCTDHTFSVYTPSMVAAGSVGAAVVGLQSASRIWTSRQLLLEKLHEITGVDLDILRECLAQVETTLRANLLHISNHPNKNAEHPGDATAHNTAGCRQVDNTPTDVDMVF